MKLKLKKNIKNQKTLKKRKKTQLYEKNEKTSFTVSRTETTLKNTCLNKIFISIVQKKFQPTIQKQKETLEQGT